MIEEQVFNAFIFEYEKVLNLLLDIGAMFIMVFVVFLCKSILSEDEDLKHADDIELYLISIAFGIVSQPFFFCFFILLGMGLKCIFIK